ncbi:keratin, type I cytoskeletal 19-like [Lithobates pipiens]
MSDSNKQNQTGKHKGSNIFNQITSLSLRGFRKDNNAGTWRPISFQAKPSGSPTVTKHHSFNHGSNFGLTYSNFGKEVIHNRESKKHSLLTTNEKETMRFLNDRLATYLEKVRSVEKENANLEKKIRDWYDKNHPQTLPDFSHYFAEMEELQRKVFRSTMENTRLTRQIDNTRLAADDFHNKYEMEYKLRTEIELDLKDLRNELEKIKEEVQYLDIDHQHLQQDLLQKKKANEDKVNSLYSQLGARVTVEVETPQSADLNKILSEIREQYEDLMESNKAEAEKWFLAKSEELKCNVESKSSEQLPTHQSEIIELKRTVHTLEIDLQSQLSMKMALESTMTEKKGSYSSQLSQLQQLINQVEGNLSQVRDKQERQNDDYKALMHVTTHLEREIATYQLLLEKQDIRVPRRMQHFSEGRSKPVRVVSITEEVESRKIVSPRESC